MVTRKRLQCVDGHFEGDFLFAGFSEVDCERVVFNLCDYANSPCAVVDKVAYIEGNVLFKVRNSFEDVAVALCKV